MMKTEIRRRFDEVAPAWKKWHGVMGPALAPVSETLLELGGVREGGWVLDVACGIGEPALDAARRVGPQGKVVGIDLSKRMVAVATERAKEAGLTNVSFQEQDAESLETGPESAYDAVLSRFGLMFLPDLEAGLRGMRRVVVHDGWMAAAVWGPPEKVPFIAVARTAVAEFIPRALPSSHEPGAFALSAPGKLEQMLSSGGWREVRGERMTVVFELPSVEAYVELTREMTSVGALVAEQATVGADVVWAAVAEAARPYAAADGKVSFICDATCVAARR